MDLKRGPWLQPLDIRLDASDQSEGDLLFGIGRVDRQEFSEALEQDLRFVEGCDPNEGAGSSSFEASQAARSTPLNGAWADGESGGRRSSCGSSAAEAEVTSRREAAIGIAAAAITKARRDRLCCMVVIEKSPEARWQVARAASLRGTRSGRRSSSRCRARGSTETTIDLASSIMSASGT